MAESTRWEEVRRPSDPSIRQEMERAVRTFDSYRFFARRVASDSETWRAVCEEYPDVVVEAPTCLEALDGAQREVSDKMLEGEYPEPGHWRGNTEQDIVEAKELWNTYKFCAPCDTNCPCCAHGCNRTPEQRLEAVAAYLESMDRAGVWDMLDNVD